MLWKESCGIFPIPVVEVPRLRCRRWEHPRTIVPLRDVDLRALPEVENLRPTSVLGPLDGARAGELTDPCQRASDVRGWPDGEQDAPEDHGDEALRQRLIG